MKYILIFIIIIAGLAGFTIFSGTNDNIEDEDRHEHKEGIVDEHKEEKFKDSSKSTINDGAKISFDRVLHDFGVIPQFGGVVEAIFIVKNEGTKTLEIGDITTSCSCTSALISSKSIPKGEEAELTVIFDPDFHEEPVDVFKRTVFIPTNDPNNLEAEVAIQVDIEEGK